MNDAWDLDAVAPEQMSERIRFGLPEVDGAELQLAEPQEVAGRGFDLAAPPPARDKARGSGAWPRSGTE
jgi:hypothetical protein